MSNFKTSALKYCKLKPCKRCPILCILVSQNSKHGQFQNFWMYQKYCVKIVSKMSLNTCSNFNFNQICNCNYGMQGLTVNCKYFQKGSISCSLIYISCAPSKNDHQLKQFWCWKHITCSVNNVSCLPKTSKYLSKNEKN